MRIQDKRLSQTIDQQDPSIHDRGHRVRPSLASDCGGRLRLFAVPADSGLAGSAATAPRVAEGRGDDLRRGENPNELVLTVNGQGWGEAKIAIGNQVSP